MRVLWAPWRLSYVANIGNEPACIFCTKPALSDAAARREALVLRSTEHCSVIMNLYPYANAHLMVAPRRHTADFAGLDGATAAALQVELQSAMAAVAQCYNPGGFNIGMNLGRCGGAGIDDHMHWHLVPRWEGDSNFMPVLADSKVIPEHLEATYDRLLPLFEESK